MVAEVSTATRTEVLEAIRNRYIEASKRGKSRMLDEFVAMAGCHRKHVVRHLGHDEEEAKRAPTKGRRTYDEAVRQALVVVWEASDRICGRRLKAALPSMVESMERHGHLELDPGVRERLFSASASTIDRLLRPVRQRAGSRRRLKRRRRMGSRVPVRTFMDWNEPSPGYLEIHLVAHGGGAVFGAFIHSLIATDISSGWTEAVPLLAREQSLVVKGLEAISCIFPVQVRGIDSDNDTRPWAPADTRRRVTFSLDSYARVVHSCSAPWPDIKPPLTPGVWGLSATRCGVGLKAEPGPTTITGRRSWSWSAVWDSAICSQK